MNIHRASRTNGSVARPIMLAIAGDSAAGKTTITKGLVAALGPERITSVCVDDYHRYDRVERKSLPFTPLHPDCNYIEIMEQHLQLLSMGQPILKPVYNHHDGSLGRPVLVEPREFVIIEGLFPLYTKLSRACFDITVYLDPPENVRRSWKVKRDTQKRGYTEEQVIADLAKREPESAAYIRPQRTQADIVVRFAPVELRGETERDKPSATLILRPTIPHPDLSKIIGENTREAMHVKLLRDDDGKPVDVVHVHAYAERSTTRVVEEAIWDELDTHEALPQALGLIDSDSRNEALAVTQLLLLFHLIQAAGQISLTANLS
ncbi:MAG: phosphoribulokinase [Actinomycetota bacterium]|nr:phosphoribulokinase [Actinomycetota bacterium]